MVIMKGIKQRTISIFIIIFVCVVATSLSISVYRGYKLTGKVLGNRALKAVTQAYNLILEDRVSLEKVIASNSDKSADYWRLQSELAFYRKLLDLKYLYTMTVDSKGRFIYLVDGSDRSSKDFSKLGDVENNTNDYPTYQTVMQGQVVQNDFSMGSQWGNIVSAYIPIKNDKQQVIAFIGADIDADEMIKVVKSNLLTTLLGVLVVFLAGITAIWIFASRLTSPIVQLRDYSLKVMNGEEVGPFEKVIKDEVGQLAKFLNNRVEAIRTILDNTGEGLLLFDNSLKINNEYSNECNRIFKRNSLEHLSIADVIYPDNLENRSFLKKTLVRIFEEKDPIRKKAYLSLLPEELELNGNHVKAKFKLIQDSLNGQEIMMVILNDNTDKKRLEEKIEKEKTTFEFVVKIMVNFGEFSCLINDYCLFTSIELQEILESKKPSTMILYDLYGKIHTFKGDFSIYGMENTVHRLHEFEQELSQLQSQLSTVTVEELIEYFETQAFDTWLNEDMEMLSKVIGVKLVNELIGNKKVLQIEGYRLDQFETYIRDTMENGERENMLIQLGKLKYRSFLGMMKLFPEHIAQLANRLNKVVSPLEIYSVNGDFMVDESKYRDFVNSLIHIFRNSIDHGIEEAEERVAADKPEAGSICCRIEYHEKKLVLIISDDGRGIDNEEIKKRAVAKQIVTTQKLEVMSEEEITELIFVEEFTTKDKLSMLSGRGIGLPAFKRELEKLGGNVTVETKVGKGTSFFIMLPDVEIETEGISYEGIQNLQSVKQ